VAVYAEGLKEFDLEIVFLGRAGCVNSPVMKDRLLAAVGSLGFETELEIIDVGGLSADDPRIGYGTPTVLVDGRDLFGNLGPQAAAPI
jgi:hypothetical protein